MVPEPVVWYKQSGHERRFIVIDDAWTIAEAYAHLRKVYADANALTTPRQERLMFLTMAWADLSRCNRKRAAQQLPIAIAQIFAWSMSLVEELLRGSGGTILAKAMGEKYPCEHCSYCGKFPCVCRQELRPAATLVECSQAQQEWTMPQWQAHLHALYGASNAAAGVAQAINRLGEEISEVGSILNYVDGFNDSLDDMRKNIAREMTDVLAWIFTTSSLLNVDVEQAVRDLYEAGCPVCGSPACACPSFVKRPGTGTLTHRFMPAADLERKLAS